mmetsp:Transcript_24814/g.71426  ORF Transcript_24814/g.71426 Transcript_24814/m.71426 type:complete len:248 (-) Transcript_24814:103-846(-)
MRGDGPATALDPGDREAPGALRDLRAHDMPPDDRQLLRRPEEQAHARRRDVGQAAHHRLRRAHELPRLPDGQGAEPGHQALPRRHDCGDPQRGLPAGDVRGDLARGGWARHHRGQGRPAQGARLEGPCAEGREGEAAARRHRASREEGGRGPQRCGAGAGGLPGGQAEAGSAEERHQAPEHRPPLARRLRAPPRHRLHAQPGPALRPRGPQRGREEYPPARDRALQAGQIPQEPQGPARGAGGPRRS